MLSPDEFWKYFGVFGALVAAAFGAPIPEEIPIATGGVLVGRDWNDPNGLKWYIMLPLCILGVVVCDTFLYWVGRKWGRWLIRKPWVQRRLLSPERFQTIEKNFHDYGIRILLIARLLPGIRTPVFLSAGIVRLPFRKFLLADVLYAIPGVNLIFWLAWWLTDTFLALLTKVESYRELAIIAILSFIAGFITATFVRRPVTTGSPEELPVLGKPVVTIANPAMPEVKVGDTPIIDGRAHPPSVNLPPGTPPESRPPPGRPDHKGPPATDGRAHQPSANGPGGLAGEPKAPTPDGKSDRSDGPGPVSM
jgi:membrane protein DedA with SNARE-associated domain